MMENKPVEVIQDGCEECKERIDNGTASMARQKTTKNGRSS
jgi:uncharacterized protein YlaI